jgi:hypothetical protein
VNDVNILKPPPAFAGDARPKIDPAPAPAPPPVVEYRPTPTPQLPETQPASYRWATHLFRRELVVVLALTLLGGVLRFIFIERPPLWGDDAFTFMRVCGTYQQMLDALQDWGFAPLHYELLWWIGQQTALTPFMMRLVPAIAGTLMVPATYWLGRELAGRKVAFVAALFAATSAYLLNYSRDAKMYMQFWLMCTVNVAALLWWLRVRSGVAWWSWVASGVAMLGLNMLGAFVLPVELLAVLLTRDARWRSVGQSLMAIGWFPVLVYNAPYTRLFMRFRWPPLVLFIAGLLIMFIGPYGYYGYFNRYSKQLEGAGLAGGGLHWIQGYNRGRDTFDLVAFTATAHLYSWEWPRYSERPKIDDAKEIAPRVVRWLKVAGVAIGALLLIGLFPWPRAWTAFGKREMSPFTEISPLPEKGDISLFWPWPAAMAIVLAWLVVPTYVWYCMSVEQIISPPRAIATQLTTWVDAGKQSWSARGLLLVSMLVAAGAIVFCGRTMRERVYKLAVITATLGGLVVLCWICFFFYERKHGGSVWMPRYLGFAWPAVAIAVAALLLRLPTRPLRWAAVALLVGVNLAVYSARLFGGTEPPTDRMARDLVDSQPADATVRMYYDVSASRGGPPGGGMLYTLPGSYYLTIYSGKPTNPQEFLTGFMGGRVASKFKRWNVSILPLAPYVFNDAKKTPGLTRLIVWEDFTPKQPVPGDDPVLQRLGDPWKRADEQLFYVRDHWTWRNLLTLRRRVYERGPVPATLPTTATSTNPTTNPG